LKPAAVVIVATVRALKMHGGVARDKLGEENVEAVKKGLENLGQHIANIRKFGVPPVVGINQFIADTDAEIAVVNDYCKSLETDCFVCSHWADGGAGTQEIAARIAEIADSGVAKFKTLYDDDLSLWEKIRTISKEIYGADDATADTAVMKQIEQYEADGYGKFPVCMAKTQYSFSANPDLKGAPSGFSVPVREVRLSAGAEFLVVICGAIMTMPGLPRTPAANSIYINDAGEIEGLF
jgi:formate--tetrahydrofolate ligase